MATKTTKNNPAKKPVVAAGKFKFDKVEKARTKSQIFDGIAANTGLNRKDVSAVFDCLTDMISKDIKKTGPQMFNLPGLLKITVKRKPATKARKGINPFTKEEIMIKAKPAGNSVKVRPLKALKDMV